MLGRYLVEVLSQKHIVFAIVRNKKKLQFKLNKNISVLEMDLNKINTKVLPSKRDTIYYLAQSNQYKKFPKGTDDMIFINVYAPNILAKWATKNKVKKFIYASSGCAIYGSYGEMPLKEDFISLHLTTPYQINKMTGEMYSNFYFHHYGLKTVNCRFFNSFGPGEVPGQYRNVIPNFIYWSMLKKSLPLTGTGDETRDFTYVLDLVQGLIKAAFYEEGIGQAFNLASGKEVKIKNMISLVNESTGSSLPVTKYPSRKWDTKKRLLASIELAGNLIDYKPIISFEDGLKANFDWFDNNWTEIQSSADFPIGMSSAVRKK